MGFCQLRSKGLQGVLWGSRVGHVQERSEVWGGFRVAAKS